MVQIDGMDNAKSYLPRFIVKTKENQGTERLPSKISGCIVYSGYYAGKRKCSFFINHDQVLHSFSIFVVCTSTVCFDLSLKFSTFESFFFLVSFLTLVVFMLKLLKLFFDFLFSEAVFFYFNQSLKTEPKLYKLEIILYFL